MQILKSRNILIFAALIGIVVLLTLKNNTTNPTKNKKDTLIMGIAAGYAPFISINPQGDYEGFDIDVAKSLAALLNKELVLKDLGTMTSLMMALEQGSIDAIIWGISITQDRLKKYTMINYQGKTSTAYSLLFWQQIPQSITTINDMNGKIICVEPSSCQSTFLNKYKDITIMPTEKVDDALLNIQYGKADAALVEPTIAKKFKTKFPEIQILNVPLDLEDQVHGIGIVIQKNNKELADQISSALEILKKNGTINAFENKWGIE